MSETSERIAHLSPLKQAFLKLEEMQSKLDAMERKQSEPIAIIGMGCRFPGGANDPESFWQLLRDGVDATREVPSERWDTDADYNPNLENPQKICTRRGAFLDIEVDQFDAEFFAISPREAVNMDPQQRLLLEVSWEALENAGIAPNKLNGSRSGVFVGINSDDYKQLQMISGDAEANAYFFTGNTPSVAAGRLSYFLGLQGPTLSVDTACSSSLVAVHLACQSLRLGECRLALAGGVNLMLSQHLSVVLSKMRALSSDGRCKTFDAAADGYGRGEGCGVIVLKRVSDALADGDKILALIRGTAINHDGKSSGLTVPNGLAQQAVVRAALENAKVKPASVSYVEVHGTGTALGDPIEVEALRAVLAEGRSNSQPITLGSVKTNIGHLEAAAGIAGLMKVVLAMQHGELPPHLHLNQLNPALSQEGIPIVIPKELTSWSSVNGQQRLAGVSSFGMSGTNAHVILEEPPSKKTRGHGDTGTQGQLLPVSCASRPLDLLTLSAKTEKALMELAQKYAAYLQSQKQASLADICFTANTGRSSGGAASLTHFVHRLAVVADSPVQMHQQLAAFSCGERPKGLVSGQLAHTQQPKVAFLFSGQGSQYIGMGRELYDTQPTFRQALEQCDQLLRPYLDKPLLEILYPPAGVTSPLDQTAYTQPALFAIEYALAQLWLSWGIQPDAVMGHSVGEYVAACIAGVFSLEDGLMLIRERGRLMQTLPTGGEMVAVFASEARVAAAIVSYEEQVTIAAVNSPREVVISGATLAVEAVVAKLTADNIETRRLNVSHAFHSPLMEPILDSFEQIAAKVFEKTAANVKYSSPKMSLISNLTGKLMTGKEIADPEYWRRHIRESVKFAESMQTLHAQGYKVFVEIGPHPVLLGMGRRCLPDDTGVWVHSLRKGHSDWQQLLQSLGELYIHGIEVDWAGFDRDYQRQRQQLPTYPFQRSRYWIEQKTDHKHSDWLYKIEWQPKSRTLSQSASVDNEPVEHGTWLIFGDAPKGSRPKGDRHSGIGSALAKLLEKRGQTCVIVYPGDSYDSSAEGYVQINPAQPEDFQRLIKEVLSSPCHGVVHLWSLESTPTDATTLDSLQTDQLHNCGSILYLVQALASAKFHLPPLWLVTQQAQPIETENLAVAQAPIWGLGRVIALEHPEMLAGLVDIVANSAEEAAATLLEEFWQPDGEHQICWRHGKRFVARLVRSATKKALLKPLEFRADGTYLITGGLGGLGLKVAQWLVDQGVQHLVLVGRRDASVQARQQLSQLQEAGAKIVVAKADISQAADLRRVLTDIEVALPPVRGIIHTAGVLDDGVLSKQDWNRFAKVLDPKVAGAWNLHTQTQNFPLDFFVNFSSVASIHGSLGQGSYAAANAFLDALAHYRRLRGLPALTINWSSWDEVGMAVSMSRRDQQRWKEAGVRFIPPRQGVQVLGQLLRQDSPQMSVLSVDWSKLLKLFPASFESTFLSEIASLIQSKTPVKSASQQPKLLQTLEQTPFQQRKNVLITHIQNEVAAVSGFDSSRLPKPQVGFFEMGMDSLMTLELKNRLQSSLSISLPPTLTFDYPTIEAVAEYLLNEALSLETPKSPTELHKDTQNTKKQDQLLTQIKQLSEDELTALIDAEVNTLAKH